MSSPKRPRKSKYIELMMNKAELRKKEKEIRIEKKIQKEREAEGDQFLDKETFLTSSYKQKLIEMKKFQEENEAEEVIGDIHNFYRNILEEKTKGDSLKKETFSQKKTVAHKVKNESIDLLTDTSKEKEKSQNIKIKQDTDNSQDTKRKEKILEEIKENSEIRDLKKEEASRSEKIMELLKKRTVGEIFEEKRQRYLIRLEEKTNANDKNRDYGQHS